MEMTLHEVSYRMRVRERQRQIIRGYRIMMFAAVAFVAVIAMVLLYKQHTYYQSLLANADGITSVRLNAQALEYESEIAMMQIEYEEQLSEQAEQIEALTAAYEQRRADSTELFELGRKFWYVFRDAPDNSGLSMDDFVLLDDLCKADDMNPHIMWHIYDIESGYTAVIDNNQSSARGLGQVLASTGKSIYENVLGLGEYNHQMAYDTETNILITQELISRNLGSGLWNAIALYSGDRSGGYYNTLLSVASSHGVNILNTEYQ